MWGIQIAARLKQFFVRPQADRPATEASSPGARPPKPESKHAKSLKIFQSFATLFLRRETYSHSIIINYPFLAHTKYDFTSIFLQQSMEASGQQKLAGLSRIKFIFNFNFLRLTMYIGVVTLKFQCFSQTSMAVRGL